MPRFFVEPDALVGKFAVLSGQAAAHAKVLRLKRATVSLSAPVTARITAAPSPMSAPGNTPSW